MTPREVDDMVLILKRVLVAGFMAILLVSGVRCSIKVDSRDAENRSVETGRTP